MLFRLITLFLFILLISLYSYSQSEKKPIIKTSKYFDNTPLLRNMQLVAPGTVDHNKWKQIAVPNQNHLKKNVTQGIINLPDMPDRALQSVMGNNLISAPIINTDGSASTNTSAPPDTNGDVGPNHYIQMVNLSFQIFNKQGTSLFGPADNSTLWNGFGDPWDNTNDGDPIVLYDNEADRWLMSQFSLPNYPNGPFYILIAISETNNPLGSWYRYGYEFADMPDYPKFSVWNDGYYMSINQFSSGDLNWAGAGAAVFERDSMLLGKPGARMIFFDLTANDDPGNMLPADYDGSPPPNGSPNPFIYFNDNSWGYPYDQLRIWEFSTDWNNTANSTFIETQIIQTESFTSKIRGAYNNSIPQQGTTQKLDALSDRLMYRLQYRNFGDYEAIVVNHSVNVSNPDRAGVRWYELRRENTSWNIYQQGTYSPDTKDRWMGSIAMNGFGDILLGYAVSSSDMYPSIRYTGRLSTDPIGTMSLQEVNIANGIGSQTSLSRYGDYSHMSIDPNDDYTFWYTQEYMGTGGWSPWRTRIASIQGIECKSNVVLSDSTINSPYSVTTRSFNTIIATNYKINSGASVSFAAGNSIILEPGFIAYSGAGFNASIKNCGEAIFQYPTFLEKSVANASNVKVKEQTGNVELFTIFPNPTDGKIFINSLIETKYSAHLYDINAKLILSKTFIKNEAFDISNYQSGLYILVIRDNQGIDVCGRRIIKK